MKLYIQILHKKIERYQEHMINHEYLRAITQFVSAYNLALSILELKDENKKTKVRDLVWKKSIPLQEIDDKRFKKFSRLINEDMEIVIRALEKCEEGSEKLHYEIGNIDKPFIVGILSYEFPK